MERVEACRVTRFLSRALATVGVRTAHEAVAVVPEVKEPVDTDVAKQSFSQSGEDMIIDFVFRALQVPSPTYLDLGAHHPRRFSNTQSFYSAGSRGVNVEADPTLHRGFVEERPLDVNLNIGVGVGTTGTLPFYIMSVPTLNTFSKDEAERCVAMGTHQIVQVIDVPIVGVNDIIAQHFDGAAPDFISIDVEGMDLDIVKSIDLVRYRPVVICVETITFSDNFEGKKVGGIAEHLLANGYFLYADTFINSIFVDKARWRPQ
jgi:FkbM family methyltransferase